jgi:small-conductance mechanosensitive channel
MEEIEITEETKMYLTENSKSFLKETAKWAYFLSIMGFILIALLVLLALLMGTLFAKLVDLGGGVAALGARSGGLIMTIYLLFAVIYFFPVYYLYQFASKIKAALTTDNNEQLNTSFEYLKSHYKFLGIFTLVVTIIYALILVLGIIGGIMSAM